MPWLTGTAFLHFIIVHETRGLLTVSNIAFIFASFLLSMLRTFLTRSGVISSVHAFAQSSIGSWFLVFIALTLAVCTYFLVVNRSHLKSEHKLEALVSRESSFLFNNLLLLTLCFTILWGTFFPILSEFVQGHKVTVGPPFFNRVAIPVALLLLLLTALGPLLAWRKTSLESLKRNFLYPAIGALSIGGMMFLFCAAAWEDPSYFYATMAAVLSALVMFTVISEFLRRGRVIAGKTQHNLFSAMLQLCHRNTRRYGGKLLHFGSALVVVGHPPAPLS